MSFDFLQLFIICQKLFRVVTVETIGRCRGIKQIVSMIYETCMPKSERSQGWQYVIVVFSSACHIAIGSISKRGWQVDVERYSVLPMLIGGCVV